MNAPAPHLGNDMWRMANATLQSKSRSFYWARQGLGKIHARRATRLYSFCRLVDDLADEDGPRDLARSALTAISHAIAIGSSSDGRVNDMLALMDECGIDPSVVQELICGVMSDLDTVQIANVDELLHYCYQVAGTVGLMMCRVLDVHAPAALPHAVDLGIAMQLTNVCRDVAEDARSGRRYLPANILGEISLADLAAPQAELQPQVRQCVAHLLEMAEQRYQNAERGLCYLPLSARCGILVAGRLYRAIGTQLQRRGCDYWSNRLVVPFAQKCRLTASALLGQLLHPGFWLVPRRHTIGHLKPIRNVGATIEPAGGGHANGR